MSLNRLKETLKPCSQPPSSASSSSNFEPSPSPNPNFARRPPKSSLSQQLKRLDLPFFDEIRSQIPSKTLPVVKDDEQIAEEGEDDDDKTEGYSIVSEFNGEAVSTQPFSLGANGPFEPLVLSSPGESPIVQVLDSIDY